MFMRISAIVIVAAISQIYAVIAQAAAPTCASPIGNWKNQLQSTLTIQTYNQTSGAITGKYVSPSGGGNQPFDLVGWINPNPYSGGSDKGVDIAFTVSWGKIGAITSWTGICANNGTTDQIIAPWLLARSVTNYPWDHILTGSDTFLPQ